MAGLVAALVLPERAFREARTYRLSRLVLVLALFLLHVAGSELIMRFYSNPYVEGLRVQQQENDASRFAFGPPPGRSPHGGPSGQGGPAGAQARGGAAMVAMQAVGVVVGSSFFVLLLFLTWRALIIFTQFFGGDEEKTAQGPHRNSQYLAIYAWFPLALRRLLEGIFIQFQDPAAAWSASSLDAYRRESAISFSPLSALQLSTLPAPLASLLGTLTDPFVLWFLFVITYGGKSVFRLSERAAFLQAGFVVVLLFLYRLLFSRIGISIGV